MARIVKFLRDHAWVAAILMIVVTVFCYARVLTCGYIWDDDYLVTENPFLRSASGLRSLWCDFRARSQYYPMVFSAFWLFYQLWNLNPFGYHLATILFHAFNAVLVWRILKRLGVPGAFWAGLIFAIHPVHVESVAWISELKNTLSGFFFLLSVMVYLRLYPMSWKFSWRAGIYMTALILYAAALLSKTVTCVLPAVILIILWWKKDRLELKDGIMTVPFFLAGLVMGLMTVWMEVHQVGASGSEWHLTGTERLLVAGRAVWFYLGKLVFPAQLIFIYPRWTIDAGKAWQYLYPVSLACGLIVLWVMRHRWGKGPLIAAGYFGVVLFPALGFFDVFPMRFSFVADHFQYLASIGPIALAVAMAWRWGARLDAESRMVMAAVGVVLLGVLCWRTRVQTSIYQNRVTLFTDVVEKNPSSWMAFNNLGDALFSSGQIDLAQKNFQRALELRPDFPDALGNLGMIAAMRGEHETALSYLNRAIALDDRNFAAYGNRGVVYRDQGEFEKAQSDFKKAIAINPVYEEGYNRLAILCSIQGRDAEALEVFSRLLKIRPGFAIGYLNRAIVLMKGDHDVPALQDLNRAITLNPYLGNAYINRAEVFKRMGKWGQALSDLSRASSLG